MLDETKRLAAMGQRAALDMSLDGHLREADVWILSIGFLGASGAIWDRLNVQDKQNASNELKAAIDEWRERQGAYQLEIKKLRNQVLHAGKQLKAHLDLEWEVSEYHDTEFPKPKNIFAREVSPKGSRYLSLREWASEHFQWWQIELSNIERDARFRTT